ncbi:hypothetical protein JKF63_02880 [Porcisia hertigi]|uniref:Transmembrane protein n=1 Tax=Porcisia hertigi TaxID=2761500 RepID=A0A836HW27_9TRYP|nr:hypothetical protein JKF63_02880 [Porcisia hertigi]
MNSYMRNIAIYSSAVYGGALCTGALFFLFSIHDNLFYKNPSVSVAVFSVFFFSFVPTILFIGATIPWLCVAYGSEAAALVFAIAPGCMSALVGVLLFCIYRAQERSTFSAGVCYHAAWNRNAANPDVGAGGFGNNSYWYPAVIPDVVGGDELGTVADGALPLWYSAVAADSGASGFEDLNTVVTRVSHT